jgi:hypothetical protein
MDRELIPIVPQETVNFDYSIGCADRKAHPSPNPVLKGVRGIYFAKLYILSPRLSNGDHANGHKTQQPHAGSLNTAPRSEDCFLVVVCYN